MDGDHETRRGETHERRPGEHRCVCLEPAGVRFRDGDEVRSRRMRRFVVVVALVGIGLTASGVLRAAGTPAASMPDWAYAIAPPAPPRPAGTPAPPPDTTLKT